MKCKLCFNNEISDRSKHGMCQVCAMQARTFFYGKVSSNKTYKKVICSKCGAETERSTNKTPVCFTCQETRVRDNGREYMRRKYRCQNIKK